jgi:Glycosyl transferase family 2
VKLVMTLVARDEADVVEAHVAFHLNAGVDLILATDHRSQDGTTEILQSYARAGALRLIRESGEEFRQSEWVTGMARLAATEYGADWVIHSDADEFWWPRGGSLDEVLAAIPKRYGIVHAVWRPFLPRLDGSGFFADRMTVRLTASAPINDPASLFRPRLKVLHRADPAVTIGPGNHALIGSSMSPLRGWYPIEVLHFPFRSPEQFERKGLALWDREHHRESYLAPVREASREGRLQERYEALAVDGEALERGLAEGSLAVDSRLRDALRDLRLAEPDEQGRRFTLPSAGGARRRFPRPSVIDDASWAAEVAALADADLVRLERRLDRLEARLGSLERNVWTRFRGRMRRAVGR